MTTSLQLTDMLLAFGSVIAAGGLVLVVKQLLHKYRRPNGKKGGIISFHVTVAFAIVTVIAMITRDWFLTGLAVILAYLIGRGRLDEGQHYMYQVVTGAVIGIAVPYGIFYLYNKKFGGISTGSDSRESFEHKPEKAKDDRKEADNAPELKLEEPEDVEF